MVILLNNNNEEYTPRHANGFNNDLIIDNSLNYNYANNTSNDDDVLDIIINDKKHNKKKKKRKKKKNTTWIFVILCSIFIFIIVFCLIKIFIWGKDNKDTSKVINDITNAVNVTLRDDDDNTELVNDTNEEETSDYWYYIKFPLIDVDITELKEKNSDTVGWINVNNTNINYPFVQTKDNSYYLNHSFDKKYNEAGWVFLDYRNNNDLNNKNNLININTADLEQLKEITGIGNIKAQSIIDYREANGGFKSLEELKNVDGIGDKTFEKIKEQITL